MAFSSGGMIRFSPVHNPTRDIRTCVKCKHYVRPDEPKADLRLGRCRLFGEVEPVAGSVRFMFASMVRENQEACGMEGRYYAPAKAECTSSEPVMSLTDLS